MYKTAIALRGSTVAFLLLLSASSAIAEDKPIDGRYRARVRTDSGTYRVPVEVEDGEVSSIRWPNGGKMKVRGAEIDDGEAVGRNYGGDRFKIEIDDLEYEKTGSGLFGSDDNE